MEYGWNYMKFHPNSTRNSTTFKHPIIKTITAPRWKSGITNDKKYFSEKVQEKVVTTQVGMPYSYYDETIAA